MRKNPFNWSASVMRQQLLQVSPTINHCCGQRSPGHSWDNGRDVAVTPRAYFPPQQDHILRLLYCRAAKLQPRSSGFVNRIIQATWDLIVRCVERTLEQTWIISTVISWNTLLLTSQVTRINYVLMALHYQLDYPLLVPVPCKCLPFQSNYQCLILQNPRPTSSCCI